MYDVALNMAIRHPDWIRRRVPLDYVACALRTVRVDTVARTL